jgi:predicted dehydrogenase
VHAAGVSVVTDEADIANARLQFEGGCVANLTASRISQKKMRKVRMFQRNAYVSMDFLTGETEIFALRSDMRPEAIAGTPPQLMGGITYRKVPNDDANALELELRDFIRAVETGSRPRVTAPEGRRALEVASRVMESMEISMRNLE